MNKIRIVLLGEKDHGKSTLLGRMLYETGSLPKDRLNEIGKITRGSGKKFEWAHLLDSFRYEREKEMTLDTTRASVKVGKNIYEFIDVPGHEELIKNMVSGAWEAQYAILVVAANAGIKRQTERHLKIAKLLGIELILPVINKLDEINQPESRFKELGGKIKNNLKNIGLKGTIVIPLIAYAGDNIVKKTKKLTWFKGPTLLRLLKIACLPKSRNLAKEAFRMPVQDVYANSIIMGRVESGRIIKNDKVYIFPGNTHHRVLNFFSGRKKIARATRGETAGLMLKPHPLGIRRGNIITSRHGLQVSGALRCNCFFFKIPRRRNLFLETFFRKVKILKLDKKPEVNTPVTLSLSLAENSVMAERFVFKENDEIIGFGRTHA